MSDPPLIVEAAGSAAEAHAGQLRNGSSGAPCINHPGAVAHMVAGETDDPIPQPDKPLSICEGLKTGAFDTIPAKETTS